MRCTDFTLLEHQRGTAPRACIGDPWGRILGENQPTTAGPSEGDFEAQGRLGNPAILRRTQPCLE